MLGPRTFGIASLRAVIAVSLGLVTAGVLGLTGAVWAGPAGSANAIATCQRALNEAGFGDGVSVVRGEESTAAEVAAWQEQRHAKPAKGIAVAGLVSPLRERDPAQLVTVCLYAGEFVTPLGPPNLDGSAKPPHTRLRLLVSPDGSVLLDSAGYDDGSLSPETPRDWERLLIPDGS